MTSRIQITFRGMPPSDAVRELAAQQFEKLVKQLPAAASCRVVLDRPIASHLKGATFSVHVEIHGAGTPISTGAIDGNAYVAIREAFTRAELQHRRARAARAHAWGLQGPRGLLH